MKTSVLFMLSFISATLLAQGISFSQIQNWSGSGTKVAMLIVDFNDGANDCYAFGYKFEGTKTAEDMFLEINNNNPDFQVVIAGGFLMDLIYQQHQGLAGTPYYWATFTWQNNSWQLNTGISEVLTDSMIFGCSYTDWDTLWNPINLPENPQPAPGPSSIPSYYITQIHIAQSDQNIVLTSDIIIQTVSIYTMTGQHVKTNYVNASAAKISIAELSPGIYILRVKSVISDNTFKFTVFNRL